MPQRLAKRGEINGDPIDRFTLAHLAWGAGMGALGCPWWAALGTALVWDIIIERPLKNLRPDLFPNSTQDTVEHIAVDAAAWLVGWGVTSTLRGPQP